MQQVLHILIVDRDREAALASWRDAKWLLPVVTCSERRRAAPAVVAWAAAQGICCDVTGQWFGRISPDATDWLTIAVARSGEPRQPTLRWTPLAALSASAALLEYQGGSVVESLRDSSLPTVPGPFGDVFWLDEVSRWISAAVGESVTALTSYRVAPHEVVVGADTARGRTYFKGLVGERAGEVRLTRLLATTAPGSFARTIATEERPNACTWWLAGECAGRKGDDGGRVGAALARLQRRLMASGPVVRALSAVQVDEAATWAAEFVADPACAAAILEQAGRAARAQVPHSWIPLDLHPTNVIVADDGTVRFIDVDESYFGPAPLAMAAFVQTRGDRAVYAAYEESWSPALSDVDWLAFETIAAVLADWRGWQRFERGVQRVEVHGRFEVVAERIRTRLGRAVHRTDTAVPIATGRSRSVT